MSIFKRKPKKLPPGVKGEGWEVHIFAGDDDAWFLDPWWTWNLYREGVIVKRGENTTYDRAMERANRAKEQILSLESEKSRPSVITL